MGKIISINIQKGGCGKTTTVHELASHLAAIGKKCLTIDLDQQGNLSRCSGAELTGYCTVYELLRGECSAEDSIQNMSNYDIIPSNKKLKFADREFIEMGNYFYLKKALAPIRDTYDYIFIDCPPSLGLLTLNALTACDSVLIPIQCEYYALEGLGQLMNTFDLVKKHLNTHLEIEGVVLTMFDARTNLAIQVVDEVKNYFKGKVYATIIPRNVRLSEAPSHGKPISLYDPKCRGAEVYHELAKEVIGNG
jgi:chromosome partitioning protein